MARPVAMLTMMGKKLMRNAVRDGRAHADAEPHHQDGHKGGLGQRVEGRHQRVHGGIGDARAADHKPSSTPTTMAMPKPAMVTQKVRQAWPAMTPLNSTSCAARRWPRAGEQVFRDAEGRADDLPQQDGGDEQDPGDQRSTVFLCMGMRRFLCSYCWMGAPAFAGHRCQPRSSCTMSVNSLV